MLNLVNLQIEPMAHHSGIHRARIINSNNKLKYAKILKFKYDLYTL